MVASVAINAGLGVVHHHDGVGGHADFVAGLDDDGGGTGADAFDAGDFLARVGAQGVEDGDAFVQITAQAVDA